MGQTSVAALHWSSEGVSTLLPVLVTGLTKLVTQPLQASELLSLLEFHIIYHLNLVIQYSERKTVIKASTMPLINLLLTSAALTKDIRITAAEAQGSVPQSWLYYSGCISLKSFQNIFKSQLPQKDKGSKVLISGAVKIKLGSLWKTPNIFTK